MLKLVVRLSMVVMFSLTRGAGGDQLAQISSFTTGSDEPDGDLVVNGGEAVVFDPDTPTLDSDKDRVYHFKKIGIKANGKVILSGGHIDGPVYWLASENVNIAGEILLNGADGHAYDAPLSQRVPSIPGAGGFPGELVAVWGEQELTGSDLVEV